MLLEEIELDGFFRCRSSYHSFVWCSRVGVDVYWSFCVVKVIKRVGVWRMIVSLEVCDMECEDEVKVEVKIGR